MLVSARDFGGPYRRVFGNAACGGAHHTYYSLVRRGFLTPTGDITIDGNAVLKELGR